MLKIRETHIARFERDLRSAADRRLAEHVRLFFPVQAVALGPQQLIQVVRYGRRRAALYGLVGERDVFLFVDLIFSLGIRFEEHSKFSWAHRILTDQLLPPEARIQRLVKTARFFFEHVSPNTSVKKSSSAE